jgi:putative glutathione S-transferase
VRRLLGLEPVISMGLCGPTHDERSWTFDLDPGGRDPVLGYERLQEAFFARDPSYSRGITVPAIVDVPSGAVVTNNFPQITLDFSTEWTAHHRDGAPDLYPETLRDEMDDVMQRIYTEVNNGVYRCGFSGSQGAYDKSFQRLFTALDWLEDRLSDQRYLMGDTITEADVRLFTTLARFDPVYHGHFKCNRNKLTELPALWAYARDLFQTPGFGDTTDFPQIKEHYYVVHTDINPTQIIPAGPDTANWLTPHGRESLGGSPFGDGTPPGPVVPGEEVPDGHGPGGIPHR